MNNELMFSSATDMWATPQEFFDKLDSLFGFTLDVCYGTMSQDDFSLIAGDDSRLAEIADAAIAAVTGQVELVE